MINRRDDDLTGGTNGQAISIFIQIFVTNLAACFILFWRSYAQDAALLGTNGDFAGMRYFPLIFSVVGVILGGLATIFYPRPDHPAWVKQAHALAVWGAPAIGSAIIPVLWGMSLYGDFNGGNYATPMIIKNVLLGGSFGAVMFLLIMRLRQQRSLYMYETFISVQSRTLLFFLAVMAAANFIPWYL